MRIRVRDAGFIVGFVGFAIAVGFAARVLAISDGDPTIFASFGEQAVEITAYAEDQLGRDVIARSSLGHDGKYFFVLANDPWLSHPEQHASVMDRPRYRAQRMFYPLVAGAGGLAGADVIIWSLLVVNLIAMGLGTWGVAALAADMGGSPWWGLAFVLNVGFLSEQNIDGAGVLAATAAFWALVMLRRGRLGPGVGLLTVSSLTREAMLIAAAGSAFWLWRRGRKREAGTVLTIPTIATLFWALYVRLRLGFGSDVSEIQEIGWPFVGIVNAFEGWISDPIDLAAGVAVLTLFVLFTRRVLASAEIVGWAFFGFVPLALLFTRQVWLGYFDISRAVAPAITAFFLLVFVAAPRAGGGDERDAPRVPP